MFHTNFRKHKLRRIRMVVAVMYSVALSVFLSGMVVLSNYQGDADNNNLLKAQVAELKLERDAHAAIYNKYDGIFEENRDIRIDWITLFTKYRGKSPESILYDLEKVTPHNIHLTNFTYDRYAGVATINAVSYKNEQITSMLDELERLPAYSKVVLVSKNDVGGKEGYRFVVRVEQNKGMGVNE